MSIRDKNSAATGSFSDANASLAVKSMADLVVFISPDGVITDVEDGHGRSSAGTAPWVGARLVDLIDAPARAPIERSMMTARSGSGSGVRRQTVLMLANGDPLPLLVTFLIEDGTLLMLCQDQRALSDAVARADRLQAALEAVEDEDRATQGLHRAVLAHLDQALAVVDVTTGRVLDLSNSAAAMLGLPSESHSTGPSAVAFTQCFEGRRRSEFIDSLCAAAMSGRRVEAELRTKGDRIVVSPEMTRINGAPVLICGLAFPQDDAGAGGRDFTALTVTTTDGMACIDARGMITHVNPAFVNMLDAASDQAILGRPITGFLIRGMIDFRVLTDEQRARTFATHMISLNGQRVPVEISVANLGQGFHGLVLRDMSTATVTRVRPASTAENTHHAPDPTQKVGTQPLRDIVAGMTDSIERDCIVAAIEMTQNNRVAAAEMLGLSRQSLYVKLRKYNLLERDED